MIFEHSIIRSTGQIWKVRVWAFGTLVSLAAALVAFFLFPFPRNNVYFLAANLFGTVLIISSLVFAVVSIKCPVCGSRWLWLALYKKHDEGWYDWLAAQSACPICGYEAAGEGSENQAGIGGD